MRRARLAFEGVLLFALFVSGFLLWVENARVRVPYLPHYAFVFDGKAGSLLIQGTWTLEHDELAWPSQTTTIDCDRSKRRCLEASAVLAKSGDVESLMPVAINELSILRWDDDLVVLRGPGAVCVDEIYNIHVQTQIVTGLTTSKGANAPGACSTNSHRPKRMRMIDGYQASRSARTGKRE